jgi:hypothetical protein
LYRQTKALRLSCEGATSVPIHSPITDVGCPIPIDGMRLMAYLEHNRNKYWDYYWQCRLAGSSPEPVVLACG